MIEIALTKVIEGWVLMYYDSFHSTIGPILDGEDGCGGWWAGPQIESPQHQMLMESWKSVDINCPTLFCTQADHISNGLCLGKNSIMFTMGSLRAL